MSLTDAVEFLVAAVTIYLGIGLLFAILFVSFWSKRLDSHAGSGTLGFRIILLPGAAAFWPVLAALLLLRGRGEPPDASRPLRPESLRVLQASVFGVVLVAVPLIALIALGARSEAPRSRLDNLPQAVPGDVKLGSLGSGIAAGVLRTDTGVRIVIEFEEALKSASAVMYWNPPSAEGLTPASVFLGAVWGPSRLEFDLPSVAGSLLLVDFADGGNVLWSVPVPKED